VKLTELASPRTKTFQTFRMGIDLGFDVCDAKEQVEAFMVLGWRGRRRRQDRIAISLGLTEFTGFGHPQRKYR
jgi:hypothetical protein